MVEKVLEITFVLIVIFLVLSNAPAFGQTIGAISKAYVASVKALQGR